MPPSRTENGGSSQMARRKSVQRFSSGSVAAMERSIPLWYLLSCAKISGAAER